MALMGLNYLENVEKISSTEWGSGHHLHSMIESIRLAFSDALEVRAEESTTLSRNTVNMHHGRAHNLWIGKA